MLSFLKAEDTPNINETINETDRLVNARKKVFKSPLYSLGATGISSLNEIPKSPRITDNSHSPYLTRNGFKSPSLSRSASSTCFVIATPWEVSLFSAGSPGAIYKSRNTKKLKITRIKTISAIFFSIFLIIQWLYLHLSHRNRRG